MSPDTVTPRAEKGARARPRSGPAGLFEPLDWALARAPLLPVEAYPRGHVAGPGASLLAAVAVSSPDLFAALSRDPGAPRVRGKLQRYWIRATTRPTPYGLFAGVGLVGWGSATDLELAAREPRTRTRPDMEWLSGLVAELESESAVRRASRLLANPLAVVRAGRVFLAEGGHTAGPVSLRATGAVRCVLEAARTPVGHEELAAAVLGAAGGTRHQVDGLIDTLWEHGVLLTGLRPPLTGPNPAAYVRDALAHIPAAADAMRGLDELLRALEDWDGVPLPARPRALPALVERMRALHPVAPSASPLQVDMSLPLTGHSLHPAVAAEAAVAAELLLRVSPFPDGLPHLSAYRRAFEARYGQGRAVPVLELLDPRFGLGPPPGLGPGDDVVRNPHREEALQELALRAQRDGGRVVELDDALVARLETWSSSSSEAPLSLDISVFVAARSAAALDDGEFVVAVGPNVGATGAGRNAGRFAELLGDDALAALARTADAEGGRDPHRLRAEVVYAPTQARSANVIIRPAIRRHEIALGATPGVPWERVIPLDELVVGVSGGRFRVLWPAADAEVAVVQGHMLNPMQAPEPVRFLLDVEADGRAQLTAFDWGPARGFPFLPRVQRGRVVLALAGWRVRPGGALDVAAPDEFPEALATWRERWSVPQHVYLAAGDNRLLLDLDDPACLELVHEELRRLSEHDSLRLEEALPGPGDAWLPGPGGHHLLELVVPVVRRAKAGVPGASGTPARAARFQPPAPLATRLRPPGSDWLYLKLYCPATLMDDVIAGPVRVFAEFARSAGLTDRWHFLRYADPDPHLRIRFHGDPKVLIGTLIGHVCSWAGPLVDGGTCLSFSFHTYDREVERYGGERGMALAEEIFALDSAAVAAMLRVPTFDRLTLAILSIDDFLASLGLDELERLDWYRGHAALSSADGREYRERRADLRELLGRPGGLLGAPGGSELAAILAARREALSPAVASLDALDREGAIQPGKATLCEAFLHIHGNRLLGAGSPVERRAVQLLRRTREGLVRQR